MRDIPDKKSPIHSKFAEVIPEYQCLPRQFAVTLTYCDDLCKIFLFYEIDNYVLNWDGNVQISS